MVSKIKSKIKVIDQSVSITLSLGTFELPRFRCKKQNRHFLNCTVSQKLKAENRDFLEKLSTTITENREEEYRQKSKLKAFLEVRDQLHFEIKDRSNDLSIQSYPTSMKLQK